jgi:hypothetical protein
VPAHFWHMIWCEVIRHHYVDTVIPADESMYRVCSPTWKLDLVAEALESTSRGREGDRTSLDVQDHIDVRRGLLYRKASMRDVQLNHEPAN